jgi:hypothetical protein
MHTHAHTHTHTHTHRHINSYVYVQPWALVSFAEGYPRIQGVLSPADAQLRVDKKLPEIRSKAKAVFEAIQTWKVGKAPSQGSRSSPTQEAVSAADAYLAALDPPVVADVNVHGSDSSQDSDEIVDGSDSSQESGPEEEASAQVSTGTPRRAPGGQRSTTRNSTQKASPLCLFCVYFL